MSTDNLIYTTAIKSGKLKATEMAIGDSVVGVLKGFKPGRYGSVIVLEVNGQNVDVFSAGNLRFLEADAAAGKRKVGASITITRIDDKEINGRTMTQFNVSQGAAKTFVKAAAPTTTSTDKAALKAELAAIRGAAKNN